MLYLVPKQIETLNATDCGMCQEKKKTPLSACKMFYSLFYGEGYNIGLVGYSIKRERLSPDQMFWADRVQYADHVLCEPMSLLEKEDKNLNMSRARME